MFSGQALAGARGEAQLTQEELARRAGLSTFTVSRLERELHTPGPRTVGKLAHALGIPVGQLNKETA